jgi:hypothetical protein
MRRRYIKKTHDEVEEEKIEIFHWITKGICRDEVKN